MNQLTIEQKLEVIKVALEMGATIKLDQHGLDKKTATANAEIIANLLDKKVIPKKKGGVHWVTVEADREDIRFTAFYDLPRGKIIKNDKKKTFKL